MRAIEFNTEAEALNRTVTECSNRGVPEGAKTTRWWEYAEGINEKWYLLINDDTVADTVVTIEEEDLKRSLID